MIFVRNLKTAGRLDVQFQSQKAALVAFAVWDGANGDKSAGKMVGFWKTLNLE